VRIEFYGDEVHSLRRFDPETQRSLRSESQLTVLPLAEVLMTDAAVATAEARLRAAAVERGAEIPPALLDALRERRPVPEWDAFLPYFERELATVHAFLPPDAVIVLDEPAALEERAAALLREAETEAAREPDLAALFPPLAERWTPWAEFRERAQAWPALVLEEFGRPAGVRAGPAVELLAGAADGYRGRIPAFLEDLDRWRRRGERIVLVARSDAQARRL
jgi:transcription-repair coupling factor (superfamily II helicase)